jgi:anti-sigma-K factor RskA
VNVRDHGGCERFGEDAAPYVLDALTEAERGAFEAHLQDCEGCREEVASLQPVVAALAAAVPQGQAPSPLKDSVMRTVAMEAGLRRRQAPGQDGALRGRPSWSWPSWRVALGVAATFALGVVVALALSGGGTGGTRLIRAQVTFPRASALLRIEGSSAELDIADMPQSPRGKVYELWVKRAGAAEPTNALFTVSSTGRATVGVPGGVRGVKVVMVTAEPQGGTSVPTSSPVVVASL